MMALAIDNARLTREVEESADAARVLTYVADGVVLVDQTGTIRLWNPAAEAITGLTPDEVLGRGAGDAIAGWKGLADSIPVGTAAESVQPETFPLETDRGERWISISGVDFFGGIVYAFRDVTDARRLEELKADFVATASHELRTPLAAVYGAAQTLAPPRLRARRGRAQPLRLADRGRVRAAQPHRERDPAGEPARRRQARPRRGALRRRRPHPAGGRVRARARAAANPLRDDRRRRHADPSRPTATACARCSSTSSRTRSSTRRTAASSGGRPAGRGHGLLLRARRGPRHPGRRAGRGSSRSSTASTRR